ncbi:SWIM zinc finger family protein [Streptosporangiaceae bacterium NEAU-GS5]|nr:SWIM zinc finger family protein [Streptosporangiaceae bacterium NEAU-GS5]
MSSWWAEGGGKPIPVEDGLRARTQRGRIGQRWWSRRFTDILERQCDPGRLARGRSYARKGQVVSLDVSPGLVGAPVQGSRPEPYQVSLRIDAYGPAEWATLIEAVGARAVYRAKLLAGEMPPELEEVFAETGLPLFPEGTLDMACTCPDWAAGGGRGRPCKHLSAVLYLLAEAFDDDPFLVLAWRGMEKEPLLEALRAGGAGSGGAAAPAVPRPLEVTDVPFAERMTSFYEAGASLSRLREPVHAPDAPPDLLLRALGVPNVKVRHIPLGDLLRPAYRRLAAGSDEAPPEDEVPPEGGPPAEDGAPPEDDPPGENEAAEENGLPEETAEAAESGG